MATDNQLLLSAFIKGVHQQLRESSKEIGSEEAWNKHCKNDKQLQLYAEVMKQLAVNYWDHNINKNSKEISRIQWICNTCLDYFWKNSLKHYRNKEIEVAKKINIILEEHKFLNNNQCKPMKMLDVGSCYNPFATYTEYFDVFPIDLAPASSDVFKCDFLKVNIGGNIHMNLNEVHQLEHESFHIVIFSLLLEYLPTPELRLLCCEKAYKLLKTEGLLLIVTPDSKHVGANAKLMKSWKYILAKIGFLRIYYSKMQHIHCIAFRKSISPKTTVRWADLNKGCDFYDKMYIPQDFTFKMDKPTQLLNRKEKQTYTLEHLPSFDDINDLL